MTYRICPQCGFDDPNEFRAGICIDCHDENQMQLNKHYIEYDLWNNMTDEEKDKMIKGAI